MTREQREWLASATAWYLDPFVDGEVAAVEYHSRSSGTFMQRLRDRWAERPSYVCAEDGDELPVPVECALAQYASHAVCKMNAQLGFGPHTPGLGRQPCTEMETQRYLNQLGKAIVEAIDRDFEEEQRAFGVSLHVRVQCPCPFPCPVSMSVSVSMSMST